MKETLETKNCIVAYVDLLGTSEAIKNDVNDSNLYSMNYILQAALDMCSDKYLSPAEVKVKSFSDNIVFSTELPDDIEELERNARIHNIVELCAYFQIAAFSRGIATRGGITIGPFFCNNIFVWGKALLRAYHLENKVAMYPRIVLDTCVVNLLPECDDLGNKHHTEKDADGIVFLDYLSFFTMPSRNEYIKRALHDTETIITALNNDERAIQKIRWVASYLEGGLSK